MVKNYCNRFLKTLEIHHQLIYQHLSAKDVLNLSETEMSIERSFRSCTHCMCRFVYCVDGDRHDVYNRLEQLAKSHRKYRNFFVNCVYDRELSRFAVLFLHIFNDSCVSLTVTRFDLSTEYLEFKMPLIQNLSLSFCNLNAFKLMLKASDQQHQITVANMNVLRERKYIEDLFSFRRVRLINTPISELTCLDLMYANCVDFQFEADRRDEYEDLLHLLENVVNPETITIGAKNSVGFRLTVHRLNQKFTDFGDVQLFSRRRHLPHEEKNGRKIVRNPKLCGENFVISLEVDEMTFALVKKLGRGMTNLRNLRIFDISMLERRLLFEHFKSLELIETTSEDDMETEVFTTRSMLKMRKSRDPLEILDRKTVDLVLQHLTTDNMFVVIEVSTRWNQIVGESGAFNRRIILRLNAKNFARNDHEIVFQSRKTFHNIELDLGNVEAFIPQAIDIMHLFSACVRELSLRFIQSTEKKFRQPLVFRDLKVLRLYEVDSELNATFFESLTHLEELYMHKIHFKEPSINLLRRVKNLKTLRIIDCRFESFSSNYADPREIEPSKTWRSLEFSFNCARSWSDIDRSKGFEHFVSISNLSGVVNAKIVGIRPKVLSKMLPRMRALRHLEIHNIWPSDVENIEPVKNRIDIYTQNHEYLVGINWRKIFHGLQTLHVASIFGDETFVPETDHVFRRLMKTNWRRIPYSFSTGLYMGSHDPLIRLPEDLHELIFQNIALKDLRNVLEVSKTWNVSARRSRKATQHLCLHLPMEPDVTQRDLLQQLDIRCTSILLYGSELCYLANYAENVRELSIYTRGCGASKITFSFPCLEKLKIMKLYGDAPRESVGCLLEHFALCSGLKSLEIMEKFNEESHAALMCVLRNNLLLKHLTITQMLGYMKFFATDISEDLRFRLKTLSIDVGFGDPIRNTPVERNFIAFLKLHSNSAKTLILRTVTGRIIAEVFRSFNILETFYCSKGSGFDDFRTERMCTSILNFVVPILWINTVEVVEFIDRLPFCEHLFVHTLSLETIREVALKLRHLKVLGFVSETDNCTKKYCELVVDNEMQMNTAIRFNKIYCAPKDIDDLSFKKLFVNTW